MGVLALTAACSRDSLDYNRPPSADLSMPRVEPDLSVTSDLLRPGEDFSSCGPIRIPAQPAKRPVDVILLVDNSPSMANFLHELELNFNQSLTNLLGAVGLDYRVIVFSGYGDWNNAGLCLRPPATGNTCGPPMKPQPVNGPRVFQYDQSVTPPGAIGRFFTGARTPDRWGLAPNGWLDLLRPGAHAEFIEVTTSSLTGDPAVFEMNLKNLAPAQFWVGAARDYRFNVVGGFLVGPGMNLGPKAPISSKLCGPAAVDTGEQDQRLAILTGGLRFGICDGFDSTFKQLAKMLVEDARLPCVAELSTPPMGHIIGDSLEVSYTPGGIGAMPVPLTQVANAAACIPAAYYYDGKNVVFCPDTCARLRADPGFNLDIFGCIGP